MILGYRLKANADHPLIEVIRHYGDLPKVECYAGQMNQVFMNLIANALDAFEEARSDRTYADLTQTPQQITITTQAPHPAWIRVEIADNGTGIPEAIQDQLFNAFFTTKGVGKGTGLGLSISYQIVVEKHHGRLWCQSEPGQGTTFILEIPTQQTSLQPAPAIAPELASS